MKQLSYKTIYHPTINAVLRNINKVLYPILPNKIKIPPSGLLTIKNEVGKKLKIQTNQTSYITQLIFWDRYQNFEYTDIFLKLIRKVNVFYDIGANIGYYSLLAAMENPDIEVVAFEPASGPLHYLKENVRINNFNNIEVEDVALSEKNGSITFFEIKNKKYTYLEHNLAGEGNAGSKTKKRNFVPIEVKTKTFNEYVSDKNQENIDLVKLDTEGTEHLILKNADIILEQMKPIFICETLFDTIESNLESIFLKYNYEFYNHTETGLNKVSSIIRDKDNGVRNCFFVHSSKFHLIKEFVQ
jgi:FkbM family methyltransferase